MEVFYANNAYNTRQEGGLIFGCPAAHFVCEDSETIAVITNSEKQ